MKQLLLLILSVSILAIEQLPDDIILNQDEYYIKLYGGDFLSGQIVEFLDDEVRGEGIKLKTQVGTAPIFIDQIVEIFKKDDYYRHKSRVYILPTAEPISNDHYLANYMIAALYGGFGILDYVSISGGMALIPQSLLESDMQPFNLNAKVTFYNTEWKSSPGGMSMAAGFNYASLQDSAVINHLYFATTFRMSKTLLTGTVFYKTGDEELYNLRFNNNQNFGFNYGNGSIGLGLGLDTRISNFKNLRFIGELWNGNLGAPTNTAVLAGVRLFNTEVSADFGIVLFTSPVALPFFSFSWTPF